MAEAGSAGPHGRGEAERLEAHQKSTPRRGFRPHAKRANEGVHRSAGAGKSVRLDIELGPSGGAELAHPWKIEGELRVRFGDPQ